MVIKKNIFRVLFTSLLLVSMQNNSYVVSMQNNRYANRLSNQHSYDTIMVAGLLGLSIGSLLTYFIHKKYNKNHIIMTQIKNIILQNKTEIKKLFYNYPGIITFYKDMIMKENKIIALKNNSYAELMNIKKTFYSIIYEIIRILKTDMSFYDIEKELSANKRLLEDVIKDIILNDPLFVERIL